MFLLNLNDKDLKERIASILYQEIGAIEESTAGHLDCLSYLMGMDEYKDRAIEHVSNNNFKNNKQVK